MSIFCLLPSVIVSLLGFGLLNLMGQPQQPKPPKEILTVNYQGFIFGEHRRFLQPPRYFFKPEQADGHILICGGAGSGKSTSLAIPSLLAWQNAVFAIDIKGELSVATASKPGQRKIFNPMLPNTYGFDPFYLLRGSDNPSQEAHEIAAALVPEPAAVKDPFWIHSAQNLLVGFILHYHHEGYSFVAAVTEILQAKRTLIHLHIKAYDLPRLRADHRHHIAIFFCFSLRFLLDEPVYLVKLEGFREQFFTFQQFFSRFF